MFYTYAILYNLRVQIIDNSVKVASFKELTVALSLLQPTAKLPHLRTFYIILIICT